VKIFVDENIPLITVHTMRELGNDVRDIRGSIHEGVDDDELWTLAQEDKRLFITTDKGFTRFRNLNHFGLIVIRLKKPNRMKIHQRVIHAFHQIHEEDWRGRMIVMQDSVQSVWLYKSEP
jgi:predicted nuclease of predicted toxin-antitoxin system